MREGVGGLDWVDRVHGCCVDSSWSRWAQCSRLLSVGTLNL